MIPEKDRFITYKIDGEERQVPAVSGGQLIATSVRFRNPTIDNTNNTVSWRITFTHPGTDRAVPASNRIVVRGTARPSPINIFIYGSGNTRTVTFAYPASTSTSGTAGFSFDGSPSFFSDRIVLDPKSSPIATFSFQPLATVSIASGVSGINNTISWALTFTNAANALGFTIGDITPTPSDASVSITGTGNSRTVTLDLTSISSTTGTGNASFVISSNPFTNIRLTSNLAARTSDSVAYTLDPSTTVSIAAGSADVATRSISWSVTFSNAGTGLTSDDLVVIPSNAVITVTGIGNTRTVRLTIPGTMAVSADASFTIDSDAFSNRRIISPPNALSSDAVEYDFPELAERTTVTIGAGVVDTNFRTISWQLTFSNPGLGLGTSDIQSRMPSNAIPSVFGTGNTRTVRFTIPGAGATSGTASFVLSADSFTDRLILGNVAARTAPSTSYTFGSVVATTTVSIDPGRINPSRRTISWTITFSNIGSGFEATDITPTPSSATISIRGGAGSDQRIVTLLIPGTSAVSGNASFVVAADSFSNRIISSPLSVRTSDSVAYTFEGRPGTTVSIADGIVDTQTRSISWVTTFSNVGSGLSASDIIPSVSDVQVSIEGGAGSDQRIIRLTLPGTDSISGTLSFIINANAFTDRIITSTETERTSNEVSYSFLVLGIPTSPNVLRRPPEVNLNFPEDWLIYLNNLDITSYTDSISNIKYSLDQTAPYSFEVAQLDMEVYNENGEFSTLNPDSFFNQVGYPYAFRCPVSIFVGTQLIFYGNILEFKQNEKSGLLNLNLSDLSIDLNKKDVINFGLEKRMRLRPHDRQESSRSGIYPFPTAVAPPSEKSSSGIRSAFLQTLHFEPRVRTSGTLDPSNVTIEGSELHTEGSYLPRNDDPIIEFKAPFRDYTINNLVKEILKGYNIDRYEISLPELGQSDQPDFTRIARVGYEIEATQRNIDDELINLQDWQWTGAVTDILFDSEGTDYLPTGVQGMVEYQKELYLLNRSSNLYRFDMETRTYRNLGVIDLGSRPAGLATVNGRLFALGRNDINEIFLGDTVVTKRMNLSGPGVNSQGRLTPHRGHATGLTSRGDELFIGYRQGIQRCTIDGDNISFIDMFSYVGNLDVATQNITADCLEYFNGRFYTIGNPNNTIFSFTLDNEYQVIESTAAPNSIVDDLALCAFKGQLLGKAGSRLAYINTANHQIEVINNPSFYFLYSARQQNTRPRLIEYQMRSDSWQTLYQHPRHAEFWSMATTDYQIFYIMGNETTQSVGSRPHPSTYNTASHGGAQDFVNTNQIWKYDRSIDTMTVQVDNTNVYRPQIAQYYHLGFIGSQNRFGFLPDTRKSILMDINNVYYIYATSDSVGVARLLTDGSTEAVMTAPTDNWHSECGASFTIAGGMLYLAITFVEATQSSLKIASFFLGEEPRFARLIDVNLIEGTAYNQELRVIGSPTPTVTSSVTTGTLPTGLTIDGARLHGTPTGIADAGVNFTVEWTATNERGTATETLNFRVRDENASPPSFDLFTDTELVEGTAYDETITVSGTPTPTVTSELFGPPLPAGLTLDGARIHGTPSGIPNSGYSFAVVLTATSTEGSVTETILFNVLDENAPRFATFADQTLTEGTAYDQTITATGTPSPTITSSVTSGTLPSGLTLDDARLSGTPTGIADAGIEFEITYSATNTVTTTRKVVSYRVKDENATIPRFVAFTANSLTEGTAYDETITATGSPSPTITSRVTTGTLSRGLVLNGPRLSGTPIDIPNAGSTFSVTFTATNSEGTVSTTVNYTVANTP